MKLKHFAFLPILALPILLDSCLGGEDAANYSEWRQLNTAYLATAEAETLPDGGKRYQTVTPSWDPASSILMQWHTRGKSNALHPLDNSTIDVKYLLRNIKGDTIDSSYKNTTYGDSIYRLKPNEMITGFWIAATSMVPGDSVTAIVPYAAGYGAYGSGSVLPFSTLIFEIKLVNIVGFDSAPNRQ